MLIIMSNAHSSKWGFRSIDLKKTFVVSFLSVMSCMRSSKIHLESERLLLATTAVGGLEFATTQRSFIITSICMPFMIAMNIIYPANLQNLSFSRLSASWPSLTAFPLLQRSYRCLKDFNLCQYMEPYKKQWNLDLSGVSWFFVACHRTKFLRLTN